MSDADGEAQHTHYVVSKYELALTLQGHRISRTAEPRSWRAMPPLRAACIAPSRCETRHVLAQS